MEYSNNFLIEGKNRKGRYLQLFLDPSSILEKVVEYAMSKAPQTITGFLIGSLAGALIAGPKGALAGGVAFGILGFLTEQKEK